MTETRPCFSPWRQRLGTPAFVLLVCLTATVIATLFVARVVDSRDRARFEHEQATLTRTIEERLNARLALLRGAAGLFNARGDVSRREFHVFVERLRLTREYEGTQGIGFAARVLPSERLTVERRASAELGRPFSIRPSETRPEYFPILYLEPLDRRNAHALGYDMFSETVRREAMAAARDRGHGVASGRVTLVQEITPDRQWGFLIYVPVYHGGRTPASVPERRRLLKGFVYSPFRAGDLFARLLRDTQSPILDVVIHAASTPAPERLLYTSASLRPQDASPKPPRFRTLGPIEIADQTWVAEFKTRPEFDLASERDLPPLAFIAGLIVSVLLASATWAESSARARAEAVSAELRQSEAQLREAARAKDTFLAMLGHELRNPLAATQNALHLIRARAGDQEPLARPLEIAERQVRHQVRLVEDLLDVARVTSGRIALTSERVDLTTSVRNAAEALRPAALEHRHSLAVTLPPDPLTVVGDAVRLEQVATNLLHNAIKYTPPGGRIAVTLAQEDREAVLRVRDNGIGIAPDLLPRVFDLFTQADTSLDRSRGGLGLGLTLVRELVERQGGHVHAASAGAGAGAEFAVHLPLAEARPAVEPPLDTPRQTDRSPRQAVLGVSPGEPT
jgi:signal transduction histidine kinase